MAVKIIITGHHSDETIRRFNDLPDTDIIFTEQPEELTDEELSGTEIYAGDLTPDLQSRMPDLRFVQLFSAGAGSSLWLPEHITLANAYGAYGDSIAEHMLTVTLMAMKRMPDYLDMQKEQGWQLLKEIQRFEGSRIMSVGTGAIGSAYLRKADALGAVCYGVRRTVHEKPDYMEKLITVSEMDELLPEMDVVALSLPGTDESKGMFDEQRLRLMKKGAILVNVGRGNAVVTDDLIKVMKEGHLKAACLDVMDPEPLPKDHPLWTAPNVYITPHISGGYRAGVNYERVIDTVIGNIRLVLEGKQPVHTVDRSLGY